VYAADLRVSDLSALYQGAAFRNVVRDSINLFACQQDPDGSLPPLSLIDAPCKPGDPGSPQGPPAGFAPPGVSALARLDSFSAWWVVDLADYHRYTGDSEFVAPLLPVARRVVAFFATHAPDGALWKADNYNGKMAFNWHTPDKAAGIDAFGNEAYYGALRGLAELERTVAHQEEAAAALDRQAAAVHAALLAELWDAKVGAMRLNSDDPQE